MSLKEKELEQELIDLLRTKKIELWNENKKLKAALRVAGEAMQEFVDKVERGEIWSKRTYEKFKEILSAYQGRDEE